MVMVEERLLGACQAEGDSRSEYFSDYHFSRSNGKCVDATAREGLKVKVRVSGSPGEGCRLKAEFFNPGNPRSGTVKRVCYSLRVRLESGGKTEAKEAKKAIAEMN